METYQATKINYRAFLD